MKLEDRIAELERRVKVLETDRDPPEQTTERPVLTDTPFCATPTGGPQRPEPPTIYPVTAWYLCNVGLSDQQSQLMLHITNATKGSVLVCGRGQDPTQRGEFIIRSQFFNGSEWVQFDTQCTEVEVGLRDVLRRVRHDHHG